jgi:hypothetical protein
MRGQNTRMWQLEGLENVEFWALCPLASCAAGASNTHRRAAGLRGGEAARAGCGGSHLALKGAQRDAAGEGLG